MDDAALLAHIAKQARGHASLKHLFKDLRIKGEERDAVEAALERLVARGDLMELTSGHFTAMAGNLEYDSGRVSVHRDGFGFLIPDHPIPGISGDIYLSRDAIRGAMNGDKAIVRITFRGSDGRMEGEIKRVLRRAHPSVVGEFRITRRGMFVAPHDERIRDWIEIPLENAIPPEGPQAHRIGAKAFEISDPSDLEGMIVNAEIVDYGGEDDHPVGRVTEVLGKPGDFGIDVEIVIRKHHLPHHFPAEVLE